MNFSRILPRSRVGICLLVIFIISSALALTRLDNALFWDDEAYVGLIASNYLKFGKFTGWTGRNLYAYANGTVLTDTLRPINPPLDVLVTAASFAALGETTWAARFPFVIIGLLSLALFGYILRREYRKYPALQVYAFGCLAFSTVFLLNIRNCRYYSLALLFTLGLYYCYRSTLCAERNLKRMLAYFVGIALSAIGLFYSNYLLGAAFLLALVVVHFIFHRRKWKKNQWLLALGAAVLFLVATVPYALAFRIWVRPDLSGFPLTQPWLVRKALYFLWDIRDLNTSTYLPWMLLVGLIWFLVGFRKEKNPRFLKLHQLTLEWLMLALGYIVFLSLFSALPASFERLADIRYLIPILPFCAGLCGIALYLLDRKTRFGAIAAFTFLICTNVMSVRTWPAQIRILLPLYISEVAHPYPTAYRGVVDYLSRYAQQDDTVLAVPEHMNYPLMFYVGSKVRFSNLLWPNTHLPESTVRALQAPLYITENFPQWLVSFGATGQAFDALTYFSRPFPSNKKLVHYNYRRVANVNAYFDQSQRPELAWHSFGPRQLVDPGNEAVYIFKRTGPFPVSQERK